MSTKPSTVIGIDPGGNGTTGLVVASKWTRNYGKPWVYPARIEAYSAKGWREAVVRFTELKSERADVWAACEDVAVWDVRGDDVLSTCRQVGAFEFANQELLADPFARILPTTYRPWWLGGAAPKGKADGAIDQALLAAYGGKDKAVGGAKCSTCAGTGRRGRAFEDDYAVSGRVWNPKNKKWYPPCPVCEGRPESPRGPLYPLWKPKSLQHCRAALAVAIYAYNNDVWEKT